MTGILRADDIRHYGGRDNPIRIYYMGLVVPIAGLPT